MKKIIILPLILSSLFLFGCGTPAASSASAQAATTTQTIGSQTDYYFTQAQQHPDQALESQIKSAKSSLDIAIYSLTKKEIVNDILEAKKRGVNVRIITDKTEAKSKEQAPELATLKKASIPIEENTHSGLMHLKVSIIDRSVVTTGSYNYSQSASTINDEVLVVIHDSKAAEEFETQFERMWNDTKNFTEIK